MKKLMTIAGMCAVLAACTKGGLLNNQTSGLDENAVFTDSLRTIQFLNYIYTSIGFTFNKGRYDGHGNTEQSTDDAEYQYTGATRANVLLYNGNVSPTVYGAPSLVDFWTTPYNNIRRCNLLIQKLPTTPLSAATQSRVRGEAKCLRAWYYMQLLIAYGGVPNVGDNVYDIETMLNVPRQHFDSLVSYLSSELDAARALLPETNATSGGYDAIDYGRVTKGVCLGLKSRLLLYAASPLFNGGVTSNTYGVTPSSEQVACASYPTYSVARWQAAADAAQAVIDYGRYALIENNTTQAGLGFYQTFLTRINPELIFAQYRPANRDFEGYYFPGGPSRPTHNLAVSFPMKNGKAITDATSGYDPANPYANRDPRFRYSMTYNGARLPYNGSVMQPVWQYIGAASGTGYVGNMSPTGYWSRKMCDTSSSSSNVDRQWPLLRYAEILLNYAEAINETGQTSLAYDKLKQIRSRAGIDAGTDGLYGMKAGMTQAEMRAFVQNERRIELALEDNRWNDIRRWKIAMTLYNGGPTGYNTTQLITRVGSTGNLATGVGLTFTYATGNGNAVHTFRPEMYLLPIQDNEIRKMPAMVQNPGWAQ